LPSEILQGSTERQDILDPSWLVTQIRRRPGPVRALQLIERLEHQERARFDTSWVP
jgi:hypothetical protein